MFKKLLAFTCLTLSIAANSATYTYSGNNYDQIFDDEGFAPGIVPGTYDTSMSVNIIFEMLAPLTSNLSLARINSLIQEFSLSDGRSVINQDNAAGWAFNISTDSAGAITEWSISAFSGDASFVGGTKQGISSIHRPSISRSRDQGDVSTCTQLAPEPFNICGGATSFVSDRGYIGDNHGVWEVSGIAQVPIPAAAWLFGSALLGLGVVKRKKA